MLLPKFTTFYFYVFFFPHTIFEKCNRRDIEMIRPYRYWPEF